MHTHTHTRAIKCLNRKALNVMTTYVRFKENNDILFRQYKSCCLHFPEIGSRELIWSCLKGKGDKKFSLLPQLKRGSIVRSDLLKLFWKHCRASPVSFQEVLSVSCQDTFLKWSSEIESKAQHILSHRGNQNELRKRVLHSH